MSGCEFESGDMVGHFQLAQKLGEGGMGAVYLAKDLTLSRKVAIKFMRRSLLANQAGKELREALETRFVREARSAAAINHPNICQIHEANFDSDDWFIAMEYIRGKDLIKHRDECGQFQQADIIEVCRQTVTGLKYAWDNYKIVHRDIKPENLMLTREGMVKIVDLGLAKPLAGPDVEATSISSVGTGRPPSGTVPFWDVVEVSQVGAAIGTPPYMAPEQAAGVSDIDYSVDIYALGATLYEMCAGERAFKGNTPAVIYMAQSSKKYKPITDFRSDLPGQLISLIDDMLEPDREDRIGSYDEILRRLRLLNSPGTATDTDDIPEPRGKINIKSYDEILRELGVLSSSGTATDRILPNLRDYVVGQLILDRYQVSCIVVKSPTGVIYQCRDTELDSHCMIKSLVPGREFAGQDMSTIEGNYRKLMRIGDADLIKIQDVQYNMENAELLVVMEEIDGVNLLRHVDHQSDDNGCISPDSLIPVFRCVAQAVDRLSASHGIPHGAIRPESVFVMKGGQQVKIMDYGITVHPFADSTPVSGIDVLREKKYLLPLESVEYMAPEQFTAPATISFQNDMYSLGIVFYQMLAGRLPFKGTNIRAFKDAHRWSVPQALCSVNPRVGKPLFHVVSSLLAKDPKARFSRSELVAALVRLEEWDQPELPVAYKAWMSSPAYEWALWMKRNATEITLAAAAAPIILGIIICLFFLITPTVPDETADSQEQKQLETTRVQETELERKRSESFARECGQITQALKKHTQSRAGIDLLLAESHYDQAWDVANSAPEKARLGTFRLELDRAESSRKSIHDSILAELDRLLDAGENLSSLKSQLGRLRQVVKSPEEKEVLRKREDRFQTLKDAAERRTNLGR